MTEETYHSPMFSIVSVCFNNLEGLKKTQQSIVRQTCGDYEWIVVDGKSTDGTTEYLMGIKQKNCIWISEPDNGIYDAMNKGIALSTGDYVIFLNAGDRLAANDVLDKVSYTYIPAYQAAGSDIPDFIFGDSLEETGNIGHRLQRKRARNISGYRYGLITRHQSMIFRKEAISDLKYDLNYKIAADYNFVMSFLAKGISSMRVEIPISIFEHWGVSYGKWYLALIEMYIVRKKHHMSFFKRGSLFLLQGGVAIVQVYFPRIYNFIRFSR